MTFLECLLAAAVLLLTASSLFQGFLLVLVLRRLGDGTRFFKDRSHYKA